MHRQLFSTGALAILFAVAMIVAPAPAAEVTLSADTDLDGGAALGSITQSGGDGSRLDPWVYAFTPSGGGLDLGAFKLYTDESGTGSVDSHSIKLDLGGESITGNSGVVSLSTYSGPGNGADSGYLYLVNVGSISVGTIDTSGEAHQHYSSSSTAGQIIIGEATGTGAGPAGSIRADNLYAHQRTVFAESTAAEDGYGNDVTIYSSGDVLIQTDGGTGGVIQTYSYRQTAGDVYIYHDGSFRAARIDARSTGRQTAGAEGREITLNGDYLNNGASGTFEVGDLWNAYARTSYGDPNYDITVSGYLSVLVTGTIDGSHASAVSDGYGSDVSITGITGDITIEGTIDLNAAYGDSRDGTLTIATSGGTIRLNGGLDMDRVRWAHLAAGPSTVYIEGILANFNILNPIDGELDETNGGTIYYDSTVPENAYLDGQTYALFSGGSLAPVPVPEPATLALLGLGGLAMAVRRRRRG